MDGSARYVVGVDFGTLSGRAVVVRVDDGTEMGSAVHDYRHGVLERRLDVEGAAGRALPPDWALQVPHDYVEVLQHAVPAAVRASGIDPADVIGIGTDFTACTVLPSLDDGTPLCELPELADRPHAYAKLWKHHAAQPHADRINELAARARRAVAGAVRRQDLLGVGVRQGPAAPRGGPRGLRGAPSTGSRPPTGSCGSSPTSTSATPAPPATRRSTRTAPTRRRTSSPRSTPASPASSTDKVERPIAQLGERVGSLTAEPRRGPACPPGIAVCAGNVDAHVSAPAANAIEPGQMVAIMGTSTCHIMSSDVLAEVPGMCGVVDGGIVPGLWGYEAGQSGVGDIFAWYVDNQLPSSYHDAAAAAGVDVHEHLARLAAALPVGGHGLVALDWHSGNRSVLVDHDLSGVIVGLTLATTPEEIYLALLESTAFGTRTIIEAFEASGVAVDEFVVVGGLLKNSFLMQLYADVIRRPIGVITSDQGPALGSAIHAAVAAGAYPDIRVAAKAMGKLERARSRPTPAGPPCTTGCTPSTPRSTTTSAAAATTSCIACGR